MLCQCTVYPEQKQLEEPITIEEEGDDTAQSYGLYLKACYQQSKGELEKSFKTYQSLFSNKHASYAYEGFLKLLFDAGQFESIVQLEAQKKREFKEIFTHNLMIKLIFAQAFLYLGYDAKAENLFTELTEQYPDDEQVAYYSAVSYLKNGQFDRALTFLDKCLQRSGLKSKYFLFHFLKSKVYMQKNQPQKALVALEKSLKLFPKFDQGWLFKGILYEQMGKINEAITGYKNFLDIVGSDVMIEKQLVQLLFSQKRFQEAEQYLKKIKSDAPEYYFDLALLAFRSHHFSQALIHVAHALEKNPGFVKAKLLKIDTLLALGKTDQVLTFVSDWIVQEPENNAVLHTFLLLKKTCISLGSLLTTLEQVVKKKKSVGLFSVLADLYLEKKDYKSGLIFYKKVFSLSQSKQLRAHVLFQISYCYFALQQPKMLEKTLQHALQQQLVYPAAYNLLAYHYASTNQHLDQALHLIDKALSLAPMRYDFLDTKGFILLKLGKKKESIKVLEEAHRSAPRDRVILQHLKDAQIGNE